MNMKESYEYPNLIYSIRLMLMKKKKKKKIKEKVIPYFKLGNQEISTISCIV